MTTIAAPRTASVAPVVLVVAVAGAVWAWAQLEGFNGARFPAAPIAFLTFLLVQLTIRRARWSLDRPLGPGNVGLMLFAVQLVLLPVILVTDGPSPGVLQLLPADTYINTAILLQSAAYAAYAVGYVARNATVRPRRLLPEPGITTGVSVAFVAVGGLGLALAFPSLGALVDYFSGQGDVFTVEGPSTLAGAASSFLRPFLVYGLIVLWAWLLTRRRPGRRVTVAELGLAALAIAAAGTYGYNRGSVVVPMLALITAYSCFGRRQGAVRIVVVLMLLAAVAYLFGQFRTEYTATQGGRITTAQAGIDGPGSTFLDTVSAYANGPRVLAIIVQDVDRSGLRTPSTVLGSALLPVPILGKPFRDDSGPAAYNELLDRGGANADQILGFGAELYWNFGPAGILVGFALLGMAVRAFDDRVEGSTDALASYTWSYCGIWVALLTINSLSVIAQIIVFFSWPIAAAVLISRVTASRTSGASS